MTEASHPQVLRQLVGRPRRHPHLLAERVHRLNGGHEVVVARDEDSRVEGVRGGVVDQVRDQAGVHAFLGRVLVLLPAPGTAPRTTHPRLALDEVPGSELESLQEALDERRRIRRDADVVVGAGEERVGASRLLRDPRREPVVVHAERLVVAQEGAVEVLTVKENGDLHHACSNGKTVLIVVDDPRPEPATRPYQKIRSKSSRFNPRSFTPRRCGDRAPEVFSARRCRGMPGRSRRRARL